MPEHIYYDFACQLSEYCLNRGPELFKSTRFWHDLFHFIGHLCEINFKSGRILGQEGVNTEICEQVNSFLQCIKYTGSHLSQDHFTFFLQFFLYLMNKDKKRNFQKLAGIAIVGQSGPFMSGNTFISWVFSWIAAFKIDFRKEVEPWCEYKPKILACDGTHIGVSV